MTASTTRSVLVTGAGSGIGAAAVRELLARGWRVFGGVRRREQALQLGKQLGPAFVPLVFDVCSARAVAAAAARVRRLLDGGPLDALVNVAGQTVLGPLAELDTAALRRQFEVNLFGLFEVTRRFLPLLGVPRGAARPPGRIVNMSSVSGRVAYPFFGAYAASKHALEGLSDALRRELYPYGVDVILIEPAIVDTPLVQKSIAQAPAFRNGPYAQAIAATLEMTGIRRGGNLLPVQRVVRAVIHALESPRPRARYPIPLGRLKGWVLPRLLPARLVDRAVARALRLRPRDLPPEAAGVRALGRGRRA